MAIIKISDYMTIGEAADFLGVDSITLRRWDNAGKLKARRHPISGYRLYMKKELGILLKAIRTPGGNKWKK